jgi:hypothetical protein
MDSLYRVCNGKTADHAPVARSLITAVVITNLPIRGSFGVASRISYSIPMPRVLPSAFASMKDFNPGLR